MKILISYFFAILLFSQGNLLSLNSKKILFLHKDFYCSSIEDFNAIVGKKQNSPHLFLEQDIKISKPNMSFVNLVIVGKILSRGTVEKKKIETIGEGSVDFNNVVFQDVHMGNMKHK